MEELASLVECPFQLSWQLIALKESWLQEIYLLVEWVLQLPSLLFEPLTIQPESYFSGLWLEQVVGSKLPLPSLPFRLPTIQLESLSKDL